MKKILFSALMLVATLPMLAQLNVQMHYDFGRTIYGEKLGSRPYPTATIENFTADKWGSTYFFVDANFANNKIASAYTEFARELRFWEAPFAIHVEYNGGLAETASNDMRIVGYDDAYLAGVAWNWANKDFSKTFSVQLLYQYLANKPAEYRSSCQLTTVWGIRFADGLYSINGYTDLWFDRSAVKGGVMFSSEPQFWVNLNKLDKVDDDFNLSVGAEVELSRGLVYDNLGSNECFYAIPTLGIKWVF